MECLAYFFNNNNNMRDVTLNVSFGLFVFCVESPTNDKPSHLARTGSNLVQLGVSQVSAMQGYIFCRDCDFPSLPFTISKDWIYLPFSPGLLYPYFLSFPFSILLSIRLFFFSFSSVIQVCPNSDTTTFLTMTREKEASSTGKKRASRIKYMYTYNFAVSKFSVFGTTIISANLPVG